MPGSIAACTVSFLLCQVNFAGAVTRSDKAETEHFKRVKARMLHGFRMDAG